MFSPGSLRDPPRYDALLSRHLARQGCQGKYAGTTVSNGLLKDAGIPEGVVMELVGHDSKSMSAYYTHVGAEALEKAVAALPEIQA